ncbi:lipoyl protein ligase domain-containing protein [Aerococcus urinae]|uniref:lipoyl protein ligase domain-containing protein n=1 Tax=Aerococcus urinae TaxID=1376 RepID=UPI0018A7D413|nr:lipoate--protein ligase [Aerococcus urinae]
MLIKNYLHQGPRLRIARLNVHYAKETPLLPFAVDDYLLNGLNKEALPYDLILHTWTTDPTLILGMQATRLPYLDQALAAVEEKTPYQAVVRPAGGLAVISEPGVVNYTLHLGPHSYSDKLSIDQAYQIKVQLLQDLLAPYQLQLTTGEVSDSYCPGKFDVSLAGKKIAGIAQRRIGGAIGIFTYLSLYGQQDYRGQVVKNFYQLGKQNQATKTKYPIINPDSMANLKASLPRLQSTNQVTEALEGVISQDLGTSFEEIDLAALDQSILNDQVQRMIKRNRRLTKGR